MSFLLCQRNYQKIDIYKKNYSNLELELASSIANPYIKKQKEKVRRGENRKLLWEFLLMFFRNCIVLEFEKAEGKLHY